MKDSTWLKFASIFHRGDATSLRSRPVQERSGLAVGISDSDKDDLEPQIRDAMEFLQGQRVEIQRLAAFPGIESLELKIGVFWWRDTLCQFHTLPPELLRLAGGLGVAVTLCVYGASGNEPNPNPALQAIAAPPSRRTANETPTPSLQAASRSGGCA